MNKPNFYAVLPASVRYDSCLSSSQKLFYAEITAMSQKEGYCWASNSYFAKLYDVANSTVTSWVNGLKANNHIIVKYEKSGKNIDKRLIYPIQKIDYPYSENKDTPIQKTEGGYSENPKENNTSNNTTSINSDALYEIPDLSDVKDYFKDQCKIPEFDIELEAEKFINHYEEMEWKTNKGRGKRIRNWKRQAGTWQANYQQWNRNKIQDESDMFDNHPLRSAYAD